MNWDNEADLVTIGFGRPAAVAGIDVRENGGTVEHWHPYQRQQGCEG